MKKLMMTVVLAVAGIAAADCDVDALKAVLEKVTDPETQCRIGNCYAEGKVVAKDEAEAVRWYRKAADQGYADAQCWLGKWYTYHLTIGEKPQAAKWYRKAAEQGHVVAQHELGVLYFRGAGGVTNNYAEAVRLFRKGAESGYARSIHNLGTCYAEGKGVPQDKSEAYRLYRKAAEMGLKESQFNVGTYYDMGWVVDKNQEEALKWYRKAAAQGSKLAEGMIRELTQKSRTRKEKQ